MLSQTDLKKFADWTYRNWNVCHVYECFEATHYQDRAYWKQKYDQNFLKFFIMLSEHDRNILYDYIMDQMD